MEILTPWRCPECGKIRSYDEAVIGCKCGAKKSCQPVPVIPVSDLEDWARSEIEKQTKWGGMPISTARVRQLRSLLTYISKGVERRDEHE